MGDGCTGCSLTVTAPISLGCSYAHILLCPRSQCRCQKKRRLDFSTPSPTCARVAAQCRLYRGLLQHVRFLLCCTCLRRPGVCGAWQFAPVGLRSHDRQQSMSAQGSSSCQNTGTDGALTLTAATSSTMRNWAWDHEINQRTLPVFLHLRSTKIPCTSSRLERAAGEQERQKRRKKSSRHADP